MAISSQLDRKLKETLGADAAGDLLSVLKELQSSRNDIGELRQELRLGFARIDARFEQIDARFQQIDARFQQIDARFQQIDARFQQSEGLILGKAEALIEKGLKEQTRFFFFAWSVQLAAIVGLYAR